MTQEKKPLLVQDILTIFGDNKEGLAIVLTYLGIEKKESLKLLDENIKEAQPINPEASLALVYIKSMIMKLSDGEYQFINRWVNKQIKKP